MALPSLVELLSKVYLSTLVNARRFCVKEDFGGLHYYTWRIVSHDFSVLFPDLDETSDDEPVLWKHRCR